MAPFRTGLSLLFLAALAACRGAAPAPPPPAPAPVLAAPVEPRPAAPPPEPEPSLQERWRAPFAVVSRGEVAERETRTVVLRGDSPRPGARAAADDAGAAATRAAAPAEPVPAEAPTRRPAPATRAPEETQGSRTHRVAWGETWYGVARRYGVAPSALEAANPDADPERIRSGQVLRIPAARAAVQGQRTHEVGNGDSLWSIARRYGVSMERIREANRLQGDRVRLGQTLIIPQAEENR